MNHKNAASAEEYLAELIKELTADAKGEDAQLHAFNRLSTATWICP